MKLAVFSYTILTILMFIMWDREITSVMYLRERWYSNGMYDHTDYFYNTNIFAWLLMIFKFLTVFLIGLEFPSKKKYLSTQSYPIDKN